MVEQIRQASEALPDMAAIPVPSEFPVDYIVPFARSSGGDASGSGLVRFMRAAKGLPMLDFLEQEALFGQIALQPECAPLPPAIVESYLSFTIGKAYRAWRRNTRLSLDDLVGAANLNLVESIQRCARKGDCKGFPHYLKYSLRGAFSREAELQLNGRTSVSGWERDEIKTYLDKRKELREQGREASQREIAKAMGIALKDAMFFEAATTSPLLYEGVGRQHEDNIEFLDSLKTSIAEATTDPAKEIAIEQALALLSPHYAAIVRLRFGLGDSPAHTIQEIAVLQGIEEKNTRNIITFACDELSMTIPQLRAGSFDILAWRANNPKRKNVLVFLALIGESVRPDERLAQLRRRAIERLWFSDASVPQKEFLTNMYGIADGAPIIGADLVAKSGVAKGSLYYQEKRAFKAMGVTLPAKKTASKE